MFKSVKFLKFSLSFCGKIVWWIIQFIIMRYMLLVRQTGWLPLFLKLRLTYPQASIGVQQCGTRICHTPCRWLIIYLQPCMSLTAMRYQSVPCSITYKDLEHDHWNTSCINIQEKSAMTRRTMTSRYDNKINYLLIFIFIFSSFWHILVAVTKTKRKVNVLYACVPRVQKLPTCCMFE